MKIDPVNGVEIFENERQAKEQVALAIEEKKRRIRENGIKYYIPQVPPNNDQLSFHKSHARIRAAFGGNRSGKSVCGACEAVWYSTGTHPYKSIPTPNFGRICCTDFTNGIEKVIIPEIYKWMPKHAIDRFAVESRTLYLKNGSTLEFMSYDQDVEKFASASRHWIWFDEEPPQDIFRECQVRLLDTKGDMWFTMTPTKGMTWIYSDIYEHVRDNPNIEIFHYDTRKNPYVDIEEIEEMARGWSEADKDIRFGGKFISLSGLIYKEFNSEVHEIPRFPIPSDWIKVCSIDPHPRITTAVLYVAVMPTSKFVNACKEHGITLKGEIKDEEVYIVYDEIYPSEPPLISEACQLMKAKEGQDQILYRLIDNSANTPDPIIGRTIKEEFERYGIRTVFAEKDVANRIFKVREKLQRNSLYFFKDVHNALWEVRHYVWDDYKIGRDFKDPKEKPRKKRDHMMDNLGYICASNPRYDVPKVYQPERKTVNRYTGY